ncbi:MAG: hypothetical protein M0R80_29420, partial [Proteobacteria bacterium]|nr:hypothetical protein [Pseudomonadota bacterium]
MSAPEKANAGCLGIGADVAAILPAWLACLAVDPTSAAIVGLPLAAAAIAIRRRLWPATPFRGRVVVGVALPFAVIAASAAVGLGSLGAIVPWLVAAAPIAVLERRLARRGRSLVARFPLVTGAVFALLALALDLLLLTWNVIEYPTEDYIKAFAAPQAAPEWSGAAKRAAVAIAREGDAGAGGVLALAKEGSPHGVYVTLYDAEGRSARGFSRGGGDSFTAVLNASNRARGAAPPGWNADGGQLRVQVDVPGPTRRAAYRPLFELGAGLFRGADPALKSMAHLGRWLDLCSQTEIGVDGIAFAVRGREEPVVVLPADPVTQGMLTPRVTSNAKALEVIAARAAEAQLGDEGAIERGFVRAGLFRTTSFASAGADGAVADLFRGNTLHGERLTRADLVSRTALAVSWLSRRVEADGRFHYELFPPYRARTKGYNLPRHAGAVYGLFTAYRYGRAEPGLAKAGREALPAGLRALDYMDANLRAPAKKSGGALCFVGDRGRAESGSTALGAIAIALLPAPEEVEDAALAARVRAYPAEDRLAGMTRCMLQMIDPDGAVFATHRDSRRRARVKKEPLYYPGEVALALVKIYQRTGDPGALEGSRRIADRQLRLYAVPRALEFPWPGDHWIIQALAELTAVTGDEEYARLAVLMAEGYVREQHPPQAFLYPDYRGAYRRIFDVPRTTRAGSRGEAPGGAVR